MNYINTTTEAGKEFYLNHNKGVVVMMNLLKFNDIADYSDHESIKPEKEITGKEAYQLYIKHALPMLEKAGSEILFHGDAGKFLIGPSDESWDEVLIIRHDSAIKFIEFALNKEFVHYSGHRTAALLDSRLLPITEKLI